MGDLAGAMKSGVPLTLDRHIHVVFTSGNTALVADDQTLTITGLPSMPDDHLYAVDRTTVQAGPPPAGKTADPASGIPIGWPVGPSAHHAYRYYDPTTQTSPGLPEAQAEDISALSDRPSAPDTAARTTSPPRRRRGRRNSSGSAGTTSRCAP
ncbi:hypothetical protein ABH920_003372 [Catenulispora sp. EB89]